MVGVEDEAHAAFRIVGEEHGFDLERSARDLGHAIDEAQAAPVEADAQGSAAMTAMHVHAHPVAPNALGPPGSEVILVETFIPYDPVSRVFGIQPVTWENRKFVIPRFVPQVEFDAGVNSNCGSIPAG